MAPSKRGWTVATAKAHLSELIASARREGPQTITRNGRSAVVVVSVDEWERRTRRSGSLAEFLLASPLHGAELNLSRDHSPAREIEM